MKQYAGSESNYLKAEDLNGHRAKVKIVGVELVSFEEDGVKETKPSITFEGKKKGMVLNKTNTDVLGKAFGYQSEGWMGKEIELSTLYYKTFDKEGIVVGIVQDIDPNDDIPF